MEKIRYDYRLGTNQETHVDAIYGQLIFEIKNNVKDIRLFQSSLIRLSRILTDMPNHIGILILDGTKLSGPRLKEEWDNFSKFVKPDIFSRLKLVVLSKYEVTEKIGDINKDETDIVLEIHEKYSQKSIEKNVRKPDAFFEILRILIIQWFRVNGPLQVNKICQLSGYSYPAVSSALEKMELQLRKHSNRSVELKSFPQDLWFKLKAASDNVRLPQGFWANKSRDTEYLKNKILNKTNFEVGFGGIIGTKHYFPGIDLLGIPRLDLTVQKWSNSKIENFVKSLDPGLKKVQPGQLPQIVIHNIHRNEPLFVNDGSMLFADELECLLDLHESRLEQQASELLQFLIQKKKNE
jgi:hypothetical protein